MEIVTILTGILETNTYILHNNTSSAIVIDPGADYELIDSELKKRELKCVAVLLTHGHWDHINAALPLQENGARIYINEKDATIADVNSFSSISLTTNLNLFTPDVLLSGDETLNIAGLTIKVLGTAGHTEGSVCYIVDDVIFSGDTLFYMEVGRCDLPSGDFGKLINSLRNKLFILEGDYRVLTGHGRETTLSFERLHNPYA